MLLLCMMLCLAELHAYFGQSPAGTTAECQVLAVQLKQMKQSC